MICTPTRYYCIYCMKMLISDAGAPAHDDVPHGLVATGEQHGQ